MLNVAMPDIADVAVAMQQLHQRMEHPLQMPGTMQGAPVVSIPGVSPANTVRIPGVSPERVGIRPNQSLPVQPQRNTRIPRPIRLIIQDQEQEKADQEAQKSEKNGKEENTKQATATKSLNGNGNNHEQQEPEAPVEVPVKPVEPVKPLDGAKVDEIIRQLNRAEHPELQGADQFLKDVKPAKPMNGDNLPPVEMNPGEKRSMFDRDFKGMSEPPEARQLTQIDPGLFTRMKQAVGKWWKRG